MEIAKENVLAAYEAARKAGADSTMKVLEALFGAGTFRTGEITERVRTFEDACRELGEEHPLVDVYFQWKAYVEDNDPNLRAFLKLRVITAALNEGWEPRFTEGERRYYPWFWLYGRKETDGMPEKEKKDRALIPADGWHSGYAGFASAGPVSAPSNACAYSGSRLCLKSEALADYCGRQFVSLWADLSLIRR